MHTLPNPSGCADVRPLHRAPERLRWVAHVIDEHGRHHRYVDIYAPDRVTADVMATDRVARIGAIARTVTVRPAAGQPMPPRELPADTRPSECDPPADEQTDDHAGPSTWPTTTGFGLLACSADGTPTPWDRRHDVLDDAARRTETPAQQRSARRWLVAVMATSAVSVIAAGSFVAGLISGSAQ